jgi:hypothetical protein
MNSKAQSRAPDIESLADGSFVFYPYGKQTFYKTSDRIYRHALRAQDLILLQRAARLYQKLDAGLSIGLVPSLMFLSSIVPALSTEMSLMPIVLALVGVGGILAAKSYLMIRLTEALFPAVRYFAQPIDSKTAQDLLLYNEKRTLSPGQRLKATTAFALFLGCFISMIVVVALYREYLSHVSLLIPISVVLVQGLAFMFTISILRIAPSKNLTWGFSRTFFLLYSVLTLAWIVFLKLSTTAKSPTVAAKASVEWRIEMTRDAEGSTWPFKEPRYMLGCLGSQGQYSVYLVKVQDISFVSPRSQSFVPQYYALKGSLPGWEPGESQLLNGQSTEVFQKYVDQSLRLCEKAEAQKNGGEPVTIGKRPVE